MKLFVIKSDFDEVNHYFVVDEVNLKEKTKLIDDYPEYYRLDEESEQHALKIYNRNGDNIWEVTEGNSNDFFIAEIKEKI